MFVATINKTLKSYLFAIIGAEYILRWLPIGTHDWNAFVKPEDRPPDGKLDVPERQAATSTNTGEVSCSIA